MVDPWEAVQRGMYFIDVEMPRWIFKRLLEPHRLRANRIRYLVSQATFHETTLTPISTRSLPARD
jgi:hypothetical protein